MKGAVVLCYGTRPQIIKASILRRALADRWPVIAVDTGQHYDYALNRLLYEQLEVSPPDVYLEVGSGSHAEQTGLVMARVERIFRERQAAAAIVIGDTNSTLGCAIAAAKSRIPLVHVEAGLRAADQFMAEEVNRRAVDAIASVLCAPSERAATLLRRERPDACVEFTGDVAHDVLVRAASRLRPLEHFADLDLSEEFVYATLHRAELTDDRAAFEAAIGALRDLPMSVLFAAHPRTVRAADALGVNLASGDRFRVVPAVGYLESLALTRAASAVVTDSGGLQREAYWLGTPCVTLRAETEWVETVEEGANRLVDPASAPRCLEVAVVDASSGRHSGWDGSAYGNGNAAAAIIRQVAEAVGI